MHEFSLGPGKPWCRGATLELAQALAQYIESQAPGVTTEAQLDAHIDGLTSATLVPILRGLIKALTGIRP